MAADQEHPAHGGRGSSMGEVFQRVNLVEREVGQVRTEIAGITVTLTNQGATLTRIAATLEQSRGTDWKALASWAAVVLTVIGLAATLILGPMRAVMDSNRLAIDRLQESRLIDQRAQADDLRRQLDKAEEMGRYKERVDRLDRELDRAHELLKIERGPNP